MRLLTTALLALVVSPWQARAEGPLKLITQLTEFRSGTTVLCEAMAASLKADSKEANAAAVTAWCGDWLGVLPGLGLDKGLSGLAKDYVVNYLGRSSYHDNNGPLVQMIDVLSKSLPGRAGGEFTTNEVKTLRTSILRICSEGKKLFDSGGSLYKMLAGLKDLLDVEENASAFAKVFASNDDVRKAFTFLAGPAPAKEEL